jgi:alpha-beta hydrolase superfamily lysophospholipase
VQVFTGTSKALLLVLTLCLSACSNLTSLMFYPQTQYIRSPEDINLHYDSVALVASDGVALNAWWLPAQGKQRAVGRSTPTVLFLHGNAENISTHIGSVYWLPEQGVNVLLLDYRGYGSSAGTPVLPDIFKDIEAATAWIQAEHPESPMFIFGQSIGASLAAYAVPELSRHYPVQGLILDAGFSGYRAVARDVTSRGILSAILLWPFTWLLPTDWDGEDHIAELSPVPLLMFHSPDDQTVPYHSGRRLFEAAAEPKRWVDSKGRHIQTFNFPDMRSELLNFLFR